ncbi:uncharacterized protein CG7065-like [Aphomia sociella]
MDLPDCPPGAEGYQDSVIEMPKKPETEENTCTKAEQEFQEHLNSLKIDVEDGNKRCMVERRGRDVSGKWIYLCYPCGVICSGESVLQTHLSGKKHKNKLMSQTRPWSVNIFTEHPYVLSEKGVVNTKQSGVNEKILRKMSEEVNIHNKDLSELDLKYNKYREQRCHIQDSLDSIKVPLLGIEYLIEHPPAEEHHVPTYICTLCFKQGQPRTIVNHLTCCMHRYNYLLRHFPKAHSMLAPIRRQTQNKNGIIVVLNRLSLRIENKYGRMRPVNIDKEEYDREKDLIHQWIAKGEHISEKSGCTFEEVVDLDLINYIDKNDSSSQNNRALDKKDPSPPVVAAPIKPSFNQFNRSATRQARRAGSESLSDISDDELSRPPRTNQRGNFNLEKTRYDSISERPRDSPPRSRYPSNNAAEKKAKPNNYDYKLKLTLGIEEKLKDSANKSLVYHEKNPEKHPLYPEEWKKFWNRRYKEIQSEGKDPYKYDFKPEWIVYWTKRMKELHDEELKVQVHELYRKMCITPPDMSRKSSEPHKAPEQSRLSETKRRSPDQRRGSLEQRRRSPESRRRSPESRRRSPEPRRRTPDYRRDRRSPESRRVPSRRSQDRRRSPPGHSPNRRSRRPHRSRSPLSRRDIAAPTRNRSPALRHDLTSPAKDIKSGRGSPRTYIRLESARRSRSPLSRRDAAAPLRNRSPAKPSVAPSMQTVLVSDDELKPDDGISPWNSDNDIESLGSVKESRSTAGSVRSRPPAPRDMEAADNVVATLRMLVALEDYLGSLGPKIVDLLTEALRMEKEKANSSEELLDRESALVLIETAKEKLKGAAQAGLVGGGAAAAARAAVVRAAATLHAADKRARARAQAQENKAIKSEPVPVAGIGEVDRAQIAQQMAAALIAQGKTDVSSEELAQLVDAVVGMAEAKKREAEKSTEHVATTVKPSKPSPSLQSGTASALQMLQSAYDENDRKNEKEDAPDAMDGLSDSDLETLLKNFNELSAEEQHSLIAYLKKLEAREPQRVERLRQYVSAAASVAQPEEAPTKPDNEDIKAVIIESDDDDYTVEEVFKSATQKVKENQMRQEMEIVKKSLEETKEPVQEDSMIPSSIVDHTKNMSSATDLLALVQASIQSTTATVVPTAVSQMADVVSSSHQPRSFGDLPEAPLASSEPKPLLQLNALRNTVSQSAPQTSSGRPLSSLLDFINRPASNESQNESWNEGSMQNISGPMMQNRGPMGNDNRGPIMQDNRSAMTQDNRGPMKQDNRGLMMQDNRGLMMQDNRGHMMHDNRGPMMQENRGPMMHDNRAPIMQDNRGPMMQDNRGPMMQDNRPPMMQDNRGPMMQDNRGPMMQDNRVPMMQDNRSPIIRDNRALMMQDNRGPMMQDNRGPNMQDNRGPGLQDSIRPLMQENRGMQMRGPGYDNFGSNSNFNPGASRGNFNNGRMQDKRQMDGNSQFGDQTQFRGRGGGRGHYGGGNRRGRGRGFY